VSTNCSASEPSDEYVDERDVQVVAKTTTDFGGVIPPTTPIRPRITDSQLVDASATPTATLSADAPEPADSALPWIVAVLIALGAGGLAHRHIRRNAKKPIDGRPSAFPQFDSAPRITTDRDPNSHPGPTIRLDAFHGEVTTTVKEVQR
jgi:hypothetical protein